MHRRIRRYTHWILIFGCLAYMIVPVFILTHQYQELLNKAGLQVATGDSGPMINNQDGVKATVELTGTNKVINQVQEANILIDTSRNETSPVGHVSMTRGKQSTLRRWNSSHPFVFVHIGKNGGTSFDVTIGPIIRRLKGRYVGNRHFDWSYIEDVNDPDVAVLLRDPVARSVSHFHFTKKRKIYKIDVSLSEYIRDPQKMLEARDIWQDGQAGAMWLTGTHIANWVHIKPGQIPERESAFLDHRTICLKAVSRLKKTLWFGFLDDQERSFDMLQWQLGYDKKIRLANTNKTPHAEINTEDRAIIESLMPLDLWLYKYAKALFEARWEQYKTGVYKGPKLPPFPEMNCKSTRYILACNGNSPLGPLYHVWNDTKDIEQHMKVLPKQEWITK